MNVGPNMKITTTVVVALAVLAAVAKGAYLVNDSLRDIKAFNEKIEDKVSSVQGTVDKMSRAMWTADKQRIWSLEFERANRDKRLNVPMPVGSGMITPPAPEEP